jgi:hypothetical protein
MRNWVDQEVMNEVDSRQRNEWIEHANDSFGADEASDDYACECSDSSCTTVISLSRDEYESVRSYGFHFAIAINHENPMIDGVLAENGRYAVVEKLLGRPRRMADANDPRC